MTEAPAPRSPRFAIAVVVAGCLPVGLGIGVACCPKTSPATNVVTCGPNADLPVERQGHNGSAGFASWQHPDDLFRAGEFELALQLYQSKEIAKSLRSSQELAFQIARCHEALGHWDEALSGFQSIGGLEDSEYRRAAQLAVGRIQLRQQNFEPARIALSEFLRDETSSPTPVSEHVREALYLLAISKVLEASAATSPTEEKPLVSPLWGPLWTEAAERGLAPARPYPLPAVATQMELARRLLSDTASDQRTANAEPILTDLIESDREHPLAGIAQLTLAHAAVGRQELATAIERYDSLIGKTSSTDTVVAAFNRGVLQFRRREYRAASVAFGRVIDGAQTQELVAPALLMRGRALLELGDGQAAAFDLKRAATLHTSSADREWATVWTGMAYLQAQQPRLAAETLFRQRQHLESEPARTAAAFLTSLARYVSLDSPEARDREALFLFRALAAVNTDDEWLGSCGLTFIGRAYRELKLSEQMAEVYANALDNDVQEPFASEMRIALAEFALESGDEAEGTAALEQLLADPKRSHSMLAGLRLAEWELTHRRPRKCLAVCRHLLLRPSDTKPILKLMGAAHEQLAEFDKAAQCFAGVIPD